MKNLCLKCRIQREMVDPTEKRMKTGTVLWVGTCSVCGTPMAKQADKSPKR